MTLSAILLWCAQHIWCFMFLVPVQQRTLTVPYMVGLQPGEAGVLGGIVVEPHMSREKGTKIGENRTEI